MMSGSALLGARLGAVFLLTGALVDTAGATAASASTTSVTVSNFKLSESWNKSWLTASVKFTIAVGAPASIDVSVRPLAPGPVAAHKVYALRAGATTETITLPPRLTQLEYRLNVSGALPTNFTIPTPPEGVVDAASISTTQGGKALTSVASPKALWVRFHFLVRPSSKTVTVLWETPGFTYVGKVSKPYAPTIDSDLTSNLAFKKGSYYAYLEIGGKTTFAKEVHVT